MSAPQGKPVKARIFLLTETPSGSADKPPTVSPDGDGIPVQFNPTSIRLQRQSSNTGGVTTQAQRRQHASEGHATLSFDLEYDTAEGDADGNPVDVRTLTQSLRQFIEPPADNPKGAPPRLRFVWGAFQFDGIASSLTEDLDYFSSEGMALRAKVSLAITGQDLKFEANQSGAGARDASAATPVGGGPAGTGPGAGATSNPVQAVFAQAGESMQQLLTRLNADPAGWRSAMAGLNSPLELAAGAQVQLGASASIGGGIGVSAGFGAGASVGIGGSVGAGIGGSVGAGIGGSLGVGGSVGAGIGGGIGGSVETGGSVGGGLGAGFGAGIGASISGGGSVDSGGSIGVGGSAGIGISAGLSVGTAGDAQVGAGFALAAAGGVQAATAQAQAAAIAGAAATVRGSFAVPASVSASTVTSASAVTSSSAVTSASAVSLTAAARVDVDQRSVSFGYGVPLQRRATPR